MMTRARSSHLHQFVCNTVLWLTRPSQLVSDEAVLNIVIASVTESQWLFYLMLKIEYFRKNQIG